MEWPLIVLVAVPILAGLGSLLLKERRAIEALHCVQAGAMLASALLVIERVVAADGLSVSVILQADALSAWMDLILGVVGGTGTLYAVGYMGEEMTRGHLAVQRYSQFFCLFDLYLAAMLTAVNQDNIAIMWIAIEGSTLSAALLIGFERSKAALEAGWKYVILSSVGIALALFGTVLIYYSSEQVLGVTGEALRWSQLYQTAERLNPAAIKIAFVFALIGYGTKAGVAPMHTWLPDAHAEAPTPVSAMLSASMLTVAVYAILRFKVITDRTVGPDFAGTLVVALGLLSLTVAGTFLLVQRDFKRLFAYSSIEHIGIALLGFGIGGAGVFAGAWHLLNHALAKSTAFYGAGLVLLGYQHRLLDRVSGLLVHMPLAGTAVLVAGLALAGMPPFGLFTSELLIAVGAYAVKPEVAGLFLLLLALAFATLLYQVFRMALGGPIEPGSPLGKHCRLFASAAVALNVGALGMIGLHVPPRLTLLLDAIVKLFSPTTEMP
ncbi:hydrogenase 4 component F [Nitrospira tepida]|uniref:Hydrogenase 4 component F n=1 Tax=Nitrospira tepida TaxID=2973512 RepID=A0AA86MVN1_9BACT|nr:hydrogenase 4 subunit F [Nitrospira tepida]CAI4029852.1 hydrogenase 4 component F [Nitrospira tepida]